MPDETTNPRHQAMNKMIDSKYKTIPDAIREQIKQRMVELMSDAEAHGINVNIQIYDKNAASQAAVRLMNKAPLIL